MDYPVTKIWPELFQDLATMKLARIRSIINQISWANLIHGFISQEVVHARVLRNYVYQSFGWAAAGVP